jgi:acyl CoA:acetate/3-ketoacid CoA transferase alpha subunit
MSNTFDQAMATNAQTTIVKTEKVSEEIAARQRPKIG